MSWHSTYSPFHPGCEERSDPQVDRIVRHLATEAGKNWDGMNQYPGFERNQCRAKAERTLAATAGN